MEAKTSWHRYGTKLRHYHLMYISFCCRTDCSISVLLTARRRQSVYIKFKLMYLSTISTELRFLLLILFPAIMSWYDQLYSSSHVYAWNACTVLYLAYQVCHVLKNWILNVYLVLILFLSCANFLAFYPRDAMLARVLAIALCLCLSEVGVLSKRLNESGWFSACIQ